MRIALLGPGKGSLYRQVVFICRWSLGQVRLYLETIIVDCKRFQELPHGFFDFTVFCW